MTLDDLEAWRFNPSLEIQDEIMWLKDIASKLSFNPSLEIPEFKLDGAKRFVWLLEFQSFS